MIFSNEFTVEKLINYVCLQLSYLFPDNDQNRDFIEMYVDDALFRSEVCINSVKLWRVGEFNYLHSSQYCIFLYFLSNVIWKKTANRKLCDKIFYLNKSLNGIDLFYEIEMPNKFFIGHSVGIVLSKAIYGEYLVLYQNSTVGKNHGIAPVISTGCILYPNTAIIGHCTVSQNTTISQGSNLIDEDSLPNSIVFGRGISDRKIVQSKKLYIEDYFRL